MPDFMDVLGVEKCTWDIADFKEYDLQGTGHDLDSEMAPPKWTCDFVMRELYNDAARKIAATVRKADGGTVMVHDPSNPFPFADPGGLILGAATPVVAALGGDGQSMSISGLSAGYVLTIGDKGQIVFAGGDRNYFFEVSEDVVADGAGVTPNFGIWPPYPIGVAASAAINFARPKCKMRIGQNGFKPGQSSGNMTFGTNVSLMEKI